MKIEDLLWLHTSSARRSARPPAEENFSGCLQEALASPQPGQSGQASVDLRPVREVSSAHETISTSAELADAALTRLEIFLTSLARGETTLKKMASLVQKLEDDSRRLQEAARNLPEESPLRRLMEETAALAYVESFKFHRGDYV